MTPLLTRPARLLPVLFATACALTSRGPVPIDPKSLPAGLTIEVTRQGHGPIPQRGQEVLINFTGTLTNGQKVASTFDEGQPLRVTVGLGQVIDGWDEALTRLAEGSRATLHVPAKLAYGERGAGGVVPPNSDMVFDIELVKVLPPK